MPISKRTCELAHSLIDGCKVDRQIRLFDGTWVVIRNHQVEVVVLAFVVKSRAVLPAVPNGAHRFDVLAHPGNDGSTSVLQRRFK